MIVSRTRPSRPKRPVLSRKRPLKAAGLVIPLVRPAMWSRSPERRSLQSYGQFALSPHRLVVRSCLRHKMLWYDLLRLDKAASLHQILRPRLRSLAGAFSFLCTPLPRRSQILLRFVTTDCGTLLSNWEDVCQRQWVIVALCDLDDPHG